MIVGRARRFQQSYADGGKRQSSCHPHRWRIAGNRPINRGTWVRAWWLSMLILLKILGIIALVVILVAIFAIRWFFRHMRGAIADALPVPCRIHPEPEPNPQWRNASVIRQFADEFRALGFQEIGAFNIPEMGGIQFLAFFHSGEQFYGCAYDHKKLEPTFDVVCLLANDTSVTG